MMPVVVYALVRGHRRIRGRGMTGERLQAVRVAGIDAIVGNVRTIPPPSIAALRRHDRVLTSLWRRSAAMLPVRFGTVVRDGAELELILDTRKSVLRERFALVKNRAQMTVRLVQRSNGPAKAGRGVRGPGPTINAVRRSTRGRRYLRSRAAEARRASAVPQFDPLRRAVQRWVRSERVEKRGNVVTIYQLIPRHAAERYRRAIEAAVRDSGVRAALSGPWPPYAFADDWA